MQLGRTRHSSTLGTASPSVGGPHPMFATGSRRDMVDKRTCGCWVRGRCQRTTLKFCFQGTVVKSANQKSLASATVHVLPRVFLAWTDHKTERHRTHDADQRSGRLDTPLSKDRNALPRFHRACRSVLSYRIAGSASAKLGRYGRFSGQYRRDGATGKLARDYPEV